VGRPDGKSPLGRTRCKWEDNIKMDLQEIGWGNFNLTQDRNRWQALVNATRNLRVPQNAGNFLTSLVPVSFTGRTLLRGVS
jgi:hypothetical protein